jgi:hypothetical protein
VTNAIRTASAQTGVDFNYLVQQADVESGLNPNAKAPTSSATGLYQFIDQTWLRMMKMHGADHGYGNLANAIHQKANGEYTVANRATRNQILNLRKDPTASSLMAAELATENHDYLQSATGLEPSKTDLYMAHFLGAGGAANFLKSMNKNPWAPAASIFPEAAHANRGVFYAQGRPLSLQEVYNNFQTKFQGGSDGAPVVETAVRAQSTTVAANDMRGGVSLPDASDWSDPAAHTVARFSSQNRMAGSMGGATYIPANYVPQTTAMDTQMASYDVPSLPLGYLRSPVDVMFAAQHRWAHDDESRYNA